MTSTTTTPHSTQTQSSSQEDFLKNAKKDLQQAGLEANRLDATQIVIGEGILSSLREPKVLGGVVVAVLGVTLGFSLWTSHRENQLKAGNDALFLAQKDLDDTYIKAARTALGLSAEAAKPAAPRDAGKKMTEEEKAAEKAKREAEQAEATKVNAELEKVRTATVDVDAAYGAQVKKLREVVAQHGGIRPGFEARMALGGIYFDHGAPAKAVTEYEAAANTAPTSLDKGLAWNLVGVARESSGQHKEALDAFEKAVSSGESVVQADALFGVARSALKLDNSKRAREALEQVKKQFADSAEASRADGLLADLPVAPAAAEAAKK
jgi:tetratricopeptide (TPR) repeat protein